jgi:hypothetical protein
MMVLINGNPVYSITVNDCDATSCVIDSYIRQVATSNEVTDVLYRYVGNMAEDIGTPTWFIAKYTALAFWSDANRAYDFIAHIPNLLR